MEKFYHLAISQNIKKLITVFFVLLFALGNMPRLYFHETLASHRDTATNCNHAAKSMGCFHQVNFNCHYDNLVVNTVYVSETPETPIPLTTIQTDHFTFFLSSGTSRLPENKVNRGPPAFFPSAV